MSPGAPGAALGELERDWVRRWPEAVALWSRWLQLREPVWCASGAAAKKEGLTGSFAMLRLDDKSIVINLAEVEALGLQRFPLEVLGHEIGHHVLCPGDLGDNGRLLARIRRGLPTREAHAPLVANLWGDLLINDRLQRDKRLDMAGVYRALCGKGDPDRLWTLYMRICELLWGLSPGTLAMKDPPKEIEEDARLGARLARHWSKDWLGGAGRFAMLCLPYLDDGAKASQALMGAWERIGAGEGASVPAGLVDAEPEEFEGAVHPGAEDQPDPEARGANPRGSRTTAGTHERTPIEYKELLEAMGCRTSEGDAAVRYYREKALPHVIPFPVRESRLAADPQPEGLDSWDPGLPLEELDWLQTSLQGPAVVPGYTTVRRTYGAVEGTATEKTPLDLFIGVDCSGSMVNPRLVMSYPVLAGSVIALSALRAGSRVMVTLSGEPGRAVSTRGFGRDETEILGVLTDYLGTGYTFGIPRLADAFPRPAPRPAHILLVTDFDIFSMLDGKTRGGDGWAVARDALEKAGGGGTIVLHSHTLKDARVERLAADGWTVHGVTDLKEMLSFARAFSRLKFGEHAGAR